MAKNLIERADLYFTDGKSDKEYHAQLFEVDGGFTVEFQYGRRGSTLATGTKTASPVDQAAAKKTFDKLVKEKTGKGYTPDVSGETFAGTEHAGRDTGYRPQLLNEVSDETADGILRGTVSGYDSWGMQEKHDGERRGLLATCDQTIGSNRKGLAVAISETLASSLSGYRLVLDGESMGARYVAFDLLELDGKDLRPLPYKERLAQLMALALPETIEKVQTYLGTARSMAAALLKAKKAEGVVFKDMDAPYEADRPASGGPALKNKFYATATALVTGKNKSKRSVSLGMYDANGKLVPVGNVTVPANQDIPEEGVLVEVRYLYAYPGGSLYQPSLLGTRTDLDPTAAALSQLKYKAGTTDDEDEEIAKAA